MGQRSNHIRASLNFVYNCPCQNIYTTFAKLNPHLSHKVVDILVDILDNKSSLTIRKPWKFSVFTGRWHMGLFKGFRVLFRHFWNINGWVSIPDPMHPICKFGAFWNIWPKKYSICFKLHIFCSNLQYWWVTNKITLFEVYRWSKFCSLLWESPYNFLRTPSGFCLIVQEYKGSWK